MKICGLVVLTHKIIVDNNWIDQAGYKNNDGDKKAKFKLKSWIYKKNSSFISHRFKFQKLENLRP